MTALGVHLKRHVLDINIVPITLEQCIFELVHDGYSIRSRYGGRYGCGGHQDAVVLNAITSPSSATLLHAMLTNQGHVLKRMINLSIPELQSKHRSQFMLSVCQSSHSTQHIA